MSKSLPFKYERFRHEAMYTMFEVLMAGEPTTYQKQGAREVFELLVRLEQQLSRFVENSDMTRLNLAAVDEPVLLGLETFTCLSQAQALCEMTQGTLNICLGRRTARLYDKALDERPVVQGATETYRELPGWDQLVLDPDTLTARRTHPAVQVDLGAVGKGFALDVMGQTLTDWGLTRTLLHGGRSTVLSLDGPEPNKTWPVTISHPKEPETVLNTLAMAHRAISSSSQIEQSHILDPKTGEAIALSKAAWSSAPNAIMADGLSTAFMIMSPEDIETLCQENPDIGAMVWDGTKDEAFQSFGTWK
jgi:thiamine biosynthesis lipoprotein